MKKVLFISNIPVPYRIDFYNELGKYMDVTVVFEAKGASNQGIRFNYNLDSIKYFKAVFLKEGDICEKKVNFKILKYLFGKYDEVVLTSYSYFTEMFYLICMKLLKKPYYLSSDGGMIKNDEKKIKYLWKKYLITGAKGYFSPSKAADEYLHYYGAEKTRINRYPFTTYYRSEQIKRPISNEEKNSLKRELNIPYNKVVLGVGQFIYRKGWDLLLESARRLPDDVGIIIVGGVVTAEYQKLIEKYKLQNVIFLDFMDSYELHKYYKLSDVFVLPTREDIWGLVINEAMNFALPIITTDQCIAGIELVENGKNGYLIGNLSDSNCPDRIAECILNILENPMVQMNYSNESLKRIHLYSIEDMASAYERILNK